MSNFYKDVILTDSRNTSSNKINDLGLLEPTTRLAVQKIIEEAKQMGITLMVFETYRSQQRQEELYAEGNSQLKNVGVHHYGLACDIVKVVNGQPSWSGSFDFLGELAHKHGLIWGGNWGTPSVHHDFIDGDHVQRCSIRKQKELFAGTWYPGNDYNPYGDLNTVISDAVPEDALSLPRAPITPVNINLVKHDNYEGERLEKLKASLAVIEAVLNSEAFKDRVLSFATNGQKTFFYRRSLFGRYIDQPYTNEEVYNMIIAADEETGNSNPNSIDLYLELINGADGSVIGYGNPGSSEIYTYSVMFDEMSVEDLANHYTHEWCHKLGFEHAFRRSANRNNSVPYAIGNIVEELAHSEVSSITNK